MSDVLAFFTDFKKGGGPEVDQYIFYDLFGQNIVVNLMIEKIFFFYKRFVLNDSIQMFLKSSGQVVYYDEFIRQTRCISVLGKT